MQDTSQLMGVVEGFYGEPWSHAARISMLRRLGALGLNAYLYAPKDAPKHRSDWRIPYSAAELDRIGALVSESKRQGVRLLWGISPQRLLGSGDLGARGDFDGDGIGDAGWFALSYKIDQLQGCGVQHLAILFDDTWATLLSSQASERLGQLHAQVVNRVAEKLSPDARVLLVPARYFGTPDALSPLACAYGRGLSALSAGIPTVWTGDRVFAPRIEGSDVTRLSGAMQRPIVLWNNAIANDWIPLATGEKIGRKPLQKLSMAPPENLSRDVLGACDGILLNGAREATATEIALEAVAAYARAPESYDGWASLEAALVKRFSKDTAVSLMQLIYLTQRHRYSSPHRVEGAELRSAIARYRGGRADRAEVERLLRRQLKAARQLMQSLAGTPLGSEIGPSAKKMEHFAQAGLAALGHRRAEVKALLRRARAIPWLVSSAGVRAL